MSIIACTILSSLACFSQADQSPLRFSVSFPAELVDTPLDGRILLILSTAPEGEPRFQVRDGAATQQVFGIDVEDLAPGHAAVIDASVLGYPRTSLAHVPPGDYRVQAVLTRYDTFERSDGHTVLLPMDRGEGQHWNTKPGNLLSTPRSVRVDPGADEIVRVELDSLIPPIPPPEDTRYIKHVKIESELLTEFWGRPMELGACVLLPHGFDEHPEARYPLVVNHGHFPYTFTGFREDPPDPDLEAGLQRAVPACTGYNRIQQEYAHAFYKKWTSRRTCRAS